MSYKSKNYSWLLSRGQKMEGTNDGSGVRHVPTIIKKNSKTFQESKK